MNNIAVRRALRTLAQLVVSGVLTAAVNTIADGLDPNAKALVLAGWTTVVALAQNMLEQAGAIPTLLPTAPTTAKAPKAVVQRKKPTK